VEDGVQGYAVGVHGEYLVESGAGQRAGGRWRVLLDRGIGKNHRGGRMRGAGRVSSDGAAGSGRGRDKDTETQALQTPENRHQGDPATPPGQRFRVYSACER
jgi:hypothetical protein